MPGISPYQYAYNNPVSFNAPSGLQPCKDTRGNIVPCPDNNPEPDEEEEVPNSTPYEIVIVAAPFAAGWQGHMGFLMGNDDVGWELYSKNGTE